MEASATRCQPGSVLSSLNTREGNYVYVPELQH
jgi:hypothetical protein